MAAPKMPRAATMARNGSVSNHSAAKSAIAIGPHRKREWKFFLPRQRARSAVVASGHASAADGFSRDGGVVLSRLLMEAEMRLSVRCNLMYWLASFGEN